MPKENVYSKYPDPKDGPREPYLQIRWTKDHEHVELATVNPNDGVELKPTPEGNGWYVQFNRVSINQAIRILRRARDQAFGKDE